MVNKGRQTVESARSDALQEMQRKGVQAYKHDGVELARMPGGEKLRVRQTKDHGDADEGDLVAYDQPPSTTGAGPAASAGDAEAGD